MISNANNAEPFMEEPIAKGNPLRIAENAERKWAYRLLIAKHVLKERLRRFDKTLVDFVVLCCFV